MNASTLLLMEEWKRRKKTIVVIIKKVLVLCLQPGGVTADNGLCVLVAPSQTSLMWLSIVNVTKVLCEEFVLYHVDKRVTNTHLLTHALL